MEQPEVLNQTNLALIIKSIENNAAASTNIINAVKNVVVKITKDIDTNKSKKQLNNINDIVKSYCDTTKIIIESLCTDLPGSGKLHELLGYVANNDTKDKNKKIEKYTVVESVIQISNIIENIVGLVEKISKFDYGFKAAFTIKKNIFLMKVLISDLLKDLITAFKDISSKTEAQNILKYLVKDPDKTITDVVNNINQTGEFNMTDTSTTKTVVKQGKLGLLDVFEKTFSLVGLMGNLKVPNLLKMKFKMIKLTSTLKIIFNELLGLTKEVITDKSIKLLQKIGAAINGDGNEGKNAGLIKITQGLIRIFETIKGFKFSKKLRRIIKNSIKNIGSVINELIEFINNDNMQILNDKNFAKRLNVINSNIEGIVGIITQLSKLVAPALLVSIFIVPIILSIKTIKWLINTINSAFKDKNGKELELTEISVLSQLEDIINSIVNIQKTLIKNALLCVPATLVMIAMLVFLIELSGFIRLVNLISKIIPTVVKSAQSNFNEITKLIGTILLVCGSIVILALVAPLIVMILTKNILPFFGILILSIGVIMLLSWIGAILAKQASKASIEFAVYITILCGALILSSLAILTAGLVGQYLRKENAIVNVIFGIVGMIAVSAIMVTLGIGLSYLIPISGIAMIGLGTITSLIGLLLTTGLMILGLSKITFDFGSFTPGVDPANGKFGSGTKAIGNIGLLKEFVQYLVNNLDFEGKDKRKLRKNKKAFKQVSKLVNTFNNIAKKLNVLQDIKLEKDKILNNVTDILLFTQTLEQKLALLNARKDVNSVNNDNTPLQVEWSKDNAKNMKRHFRRNKKILSQVDGVVVKISNIGEQLTSIAKFELGDAIKGKIEQNLTKIFVYINSLDAKLKTFNGNTENNTVNIIEEIKNARKNKRKYRQTSKSISKVEEILVSLSSITDALNSIKEIKFTETDITNKTEIILGCISKVNAQLNSTKIEKTSNSTNDVIKYFNDFVTSVKTISELNTTDTEKNINNYIKFIDKINNVEVKKLETSANMFKQMAEFSNSIKGNFEKLAETLAEDLMPILQELKEATTKVPEKLDIGFQRTSASIAATNAAPTAENITAQLNRENPNLTKEEVDSIVKTRLNERAKMDANGTISKLDELISLLKGYSGENVVVQTI